MYLLKALQKKHEKHINQESNNIPSKQIDHVNVIKILYSSDEISKTALKLLIKESGCKNIQLEAIFCIINMNGRISNLQREGEKNQKYFERLQKDKTRLKTPHSKLPNKNTTP